MPCFEEVSLADRAVLGTFFQLIEFTWTSLEGLTGVRADGTEPRQGPRFSLLCDKVLWLYGMIG